MALAPPEQYPMPEVLYEDQGAGPLPAPMEPTFPQFGAQQQPPNLPPVESYTPEQQAQIAKVLEMMHASGVQAQQAAMPPSRNPVMQDIQGSMGKQMTPAQPVMPYKGVHDRYQPYIDDLQQQGMRLGHSQDHMAMQPNQPIRNLVRGLAAGLDGYAQARSAAWESQWGTKGYASRAAQQRDNAAEQYIKELSEKAHILATLADVEAREQQGYASNASGSGEIADTARKNALAPADFYHTYQQGEQSRTGAEENAAQALTENMNRPNELNSEVALANQRNQSAYANKELGAGREERRPFEKTKAEEGAKKAGFDATVSGEKAKNAPDYEKDRARNEKRKADTPARGSAAEKAFTKDLDRAIEDSQKFVTSYDVKIRDATDQKERERFQKEKEGWIDNIDRLVENRNQRTAKATTTGGESKQSADGDSERENAIMSLMGQRTNLTRQQAEQIADRNKR